MNTQKYYNNIEEKLAVLSLRIERNSKLNILDLNNHAENFYRDLLNLIYNLKLKNANDSVGNFLAVDLIDEENKKLFQVTSSSTRTKIESTLSKDNIEQYANDGFEMNFVFLSGDAKNLKNKVYKNNFNILFEPNRSILDSTRILRDINNLDVDTFKQVSDLVNKYLFSESSVKQITSELALVINVLSKENLGAESNPNNLMDFNIDEKIDVNDLEDIKFTTIDVYKVYSNWLEKVYRTYEEQGKITRLTVLGKISGFYETELLKRDVSSVEKFLNIVKLTKDYAINSQNIDDMEEDVLELCVKVIVVDAFVRCRIFKNPKVIINAITQ
ncbi:MAG TPA: ABC-three component system protein [Lactovum miscens]|uniref:ABC-three component system protein n=1 Tax=Lactovum miscens TaxID=190387 RepID=UPI002ED8FFCC